MNYKEKIIALLNDKELSQEQKEKLEYIFPELAESEDERIKKDLIGFFKDGEFLYHKKEEIVEWLEKQGEYKSEEVLKIRQELYQSGYNDGYKHGCEDTKKKEEKPVCKVEQKPCGHESK